MNNIASRIREAKKIGVGCHIFPDGDALGSQMALTLALRSMGKEAYMFKKDEKLTENLKFLPLAEELSNSGSTVKEGTDLIIILDCGALDRVNVDLKNLFSVEVINLDHHKTNDKYGDINYVSSKSSSTGELIYKLIGLLEVEITKDMADCLYTAIATDTGSFKFQCTTSLTHEVAGKLLEKGADFTEISRNVFDTKPLGRIKLMGKVLSSIESYLNGRVNILKVTEEDFLSFGIEDRDTSDIVNFGLAPKEAEVSIVLKYGEGKIRASMRTKHKVDAGKFAQKYSGGGHSRAAGMTFMTPSFDEAKDTLLRELEAWLY